MQRVLIVTLAVLGQLSACRPSPTCTDGLRNGEESDVDCGGSSCGGCADERACLTHEDCASGVCQRRVCVTPQTACDAGPGCGPQVECRDNAGCASGSVCLDGACVPACQPPLTSCAGGCTDLRFDPAHCGTCARACAANERCDLGQCQQTCPPGTIPCGAGPSFRCVNSMIDVLHCGGCAVVCNAGERCVGGACRPACAPFQTSCNGECVSTMTDVRHCNGCNSPCGSGQVCVMGACVAACGAPLLACDGGTSCVDVRFDALNCGACGAPCPAVAHARALCLDMVCTRTECDPGFKDCNGLPADGCEANLLSDPMNCGQCGVQCSCVNGFCP